MMTSSMTSAEKNTLPNGISVLIPVFNSEGSLAELLRRLSAVLSLLNTPFEVILVDDGSRDQSWHIIEGLIADYPFLRAYRLTRNYGQHNALLCALRAARYDKAVTMDDDLQNPPEEIPKLLAALNDECDVVYGTPEREQHGLWRNMASRLTKLALQNAMGAKIARRVSAFRVFRTMLRDAMKDVAGPFVCMDVLLTWGTTRFGAVTVRHEARRVGRSNYTFGKLFIHALNMMTGFSVLPLQFASWVGFVFVLFGSGVLVFVVGRYLVHGAVVPGFAFLASIIALFSGVQLFALGIIGEYLARLYFRSMDRPCYAIRESRG